MIKSPASGLLHYVTVVKMTRTKVWVMDPAFGLSAWSAAEFLSRWYTLEHAADPAKLEASNRDPHNVDEVRGELRELGLGPRAETLRRRCRSSTSMTAFASPAPCGAETPARQRRGLVCERLILPTNSSRSRTIYTTTHFRPQSRRQPAADARGHLLITVKRVPIGKASRSRRASAAQDRSPHGNAKAPLR